MKTLKNVLTKYKWQEARWSWVLRDKYDLFEWSLSPKMSGYLIISLGPVRIGLWPKRWNVG